MVSTSTSTPRCASSPASPARRGSQGRSLLPLVRGEADEIHEEIFAEATYHAAYEPQRAVRTPRHKYIRRFGDRDEPVLANTDDSPSKDLLLAHGWGERPRAADQLYDLVLDPNEARNLAGDPEHAGVDGPGRAARPLDAGDRRPAARRPGGAAAGGRAERPGPALRLGPGHGRRLGRVKVDATTAAPLETDADTVVVGLHTGAAIAHDTEDGALAALVEAGEARAKPGATAVAHASGRRWIVAGLGPQEEWDAERAREVAGAAERRARDLGAHHVCWEVPHHSPDAVVDALVEGTLLSAYRFTRYRETDDDGAERLTVSAHDDVSPAVARAEVLARARNRARDLQNAAANDATPEALAARAAAVDGVETSVLDREGIQAEGMGAFAAVAQGSLTEPRLITLATRAGARAVRCSPSWARR